MDVQNEPNTGIVDEVTVDDYGMVNSNKKERSPSRERLNEPERDRSRSRHDDDEDEKRSRSSSIINEEQGNDNDNAPREEHQTNNRQKNTNFYRKRYTNNAPRKYYRNRSVYSNGVPTIYMDNVTHKSSYREFVLSKHASITIDEAEKEYSDYCRRQRYQDSMQFFDHFANQEWIVERTVPSYHKKYLRYLQESCKDEINYLRELLTSDQLLKKVDIENSSMEVENEQSSSVESFIHNPFENHCVFVHNVPPSCTRQCFLEYLSTFPGLKRVYFGDAFHCPPTDLCRPAYIIFDTNENAVNAFKHMGGFHVPIRDTMDIGLAGLKEEENSQPLTFVPKCSLWKPQQKAYFINAAANSKERIEKDLQQCRRLWEALEKYWNVKSDFLEVANQYREKNVWMTDSNMVDFLVFCLRRVFGYDYWISKDYKEFGMSFHHNGPDLIRSNENPVEDVDTWCTSLDEKTAEYIETLEKETLEDVLQNESEEEKKEIELKETSRVELMKTLAVPREKENNYQCTLCRKIFSTDQYAYKHLMNKHRQYVEVKLSKNYLLQCVRNVYLKDPNAQIPMVTARKQILNSSSQVHGSKYGRDNVDKNTMLYGANRYIDRDNVAGITINPTKSAADVFDDF